MERKKSPFPLANRLFQLLQMFNLTRHEKGVIVFLAASIVLGYGLVYFQKVHSHAKDFSVGLNTEPPFPIYRTPHSDQKKVSAPSGRTAFVIDINKAGSRDLIQLSGIGPVLAQRIIDYRSRSGTFKRVEEIKNVSGIGNKKFERIKEFLVLE